MTDLQQIITAALRGRRSASRELWQRVAEGEIDAELLGWLRAVAVKVLEADQAGGKHRDRALADALGLRGVADQNAEIRSVIEVFDAFEALDSVKRGQGTRALIELLRQRGLIGEEVTDDEARKRIARLRESL